MKLPKIKFPELQTDAASSQGKTVWNSVLLSTPVVLTVLATVLAGLSTSEMTWAQYHRGLAAQHQSKVGDQWGFFQAKRIRGTILETMVDLFQGLSDRGAVELESVRSVTELLTGRLHRGEKEANRLFESLRRLPDEKLKQAAGRLAKVIRSQAKEAEAVGDRIRAELTRSDAAELFHYLTGNDLPPVQVKAVEHPQIAEAIQSIQQRRAESDIAAVVAQISDGSLQVAIQTAEANVQAVEAVDGPISDRLKQLGNLLQEQATLAQAFHRAVRDVSTAEGDASASGETESAEARSTMAALTKTAATVKAATKDLSIDFKAAHHLYTARRYEREARYNQQAATIYEVQVRHSSLSAERHRTRSKQFFYGMLAAQAGVMIASFSLAVKHKSVMWGLASFAGLGAVLFGIYVYVYM